MEFYGNTDRVAWTFWEETASYERPMYVWSVNADSAEDCASGMCADRGLAIDMLALCAAKLARRSSEASAVQDSMG